MEKEIKTNLRWPGGKSKMMKIIKNFLPKDIDKYLEVFTGGGSVLLYILQHFNVKEAYANDIDKLLINYYNDVKNNPEAVIKECMDIKTSYNAITFREKFFELDREKASNFFIANKSSFSGLNKTYSELAYDKNFSVKCIEKIKDISKVINNVGFLNEDFKNLDSKLDIKDFFIYLDPPYCDNKNKGLYGDNGKLHKQFDHEGLFKWIENHKDSNKIMISYDDSQYIRELYKDYNIYNFDFVYSMTNVGGNLCKVGKEIVITNYDININA